MSTVRVGLLLVSATACRIGFDAAGGDGDGGAAAIDGGGDGGRTDTQVAWVRRLLSGGGRFSGQPARGRGAGATVVGTFVGDLKIETGASTTMLSSLPGSATTGYVVQFDPTGTSSTTTQLSSDLHCELRDAASTELGLVVAGFTAGAGGGERGPCDVASPVQAPITFLVDAAGTPSRHAVFAAGGGNAQPWSVAPVAGGYALAGVYSGSVELSPPPPDAAGDEATFVTTVDGTGAAGDTQGWRNGSYLMPGPLVVSTSGELCLLGSYDTAATVLGAGLATLGGFDAWVARFGAGGQRRFVASIRSPADESAFGNGAVLATDTGCVAGVAVGGPALVGATTFPYAGGTDAGLFVFDAGGAVTGFTVGGAGNEEFQGLLDLGGRWLAMLSYDAPLELAGTVLSPGGADLALVEVDATGVIRVHAVFGGAGLQTDGQLGQLDADTVTATFLSTGDLDVAGRTSTTSEAALIVVAIDVGR
ncbi:MAG: hypothetical protein KBG28_20910 [Kofleriaceae bacterium]|nr:hypothetical protein [Kofleriaceae bacterium]